MQPRTPSAEDASAPLAPLAPAASPAETASRLLEAVEFERFVRALRGRRPVATYTIAALIAAVFGLQLYVGLDSPPAFLRMGALSRARVAEGEVWRLVTCTFLHAGYLHVLFNVYVLVVLGIFLERLIGPARFVALYVVSASVGSAGSALFLTSLFSVGASGAVWGLLGAHAVLATRERALLPAALLPGVRKAAMINLGLNVLNSFRPHVDIWAHFAGGAAGALLFAAGALTRGLPRVGAQPPAPPTDLAIPTSRAWRAASGIASALVLAALAVGLVKGEPFALQQAPRLEIAHLDALGLEVELPASLAAELRRDSETGELVFGDLLSDPLMVALRTFDGLALPASEPEAIVAGLESGLATPEETQERTPPQRYDDAGDLGVSVAYEFPSGLLLERALLYRAGRVLRVDAYRWPDYPAAPEGSAECIARSARMLPSGAQAR